MSEDIVTNVFRHQFAAPFTSAECFQLPLLSAWICTLPVDIIFKTADQGTQGAAGELVSSVIFKFISNFHGFVGCSLQHV